MEVKYFTVDEANKTLPLVKRIVADILDDYRVWRDLMRQFELLSAAATEDTGESDEQIALGKEVEAAAHRIHAYMDELTQIGCVFKGFEEGLVDFHSRREDRDVFLCWKHGEAAIEHWHELEGGFSGRQPLETESLRPDG